MATRKPPTLNKPPAAKKLTLAASNGSAPATRKGKGGKEIALTPEEQLHAEIQTQAQARFVASAAIDAAVAMQQARLGHRKATPAEVRQKNRVKLADVKEELLLRIAEGESVFTISHDEHMPNRTSLYKWIREDPQFRSEYEAALEQRADKYVEQIADLSKYMSERAAMGASNEEVTALKSHVNTLQWIAARLNAKKYGDRQQLDVDQKITLDENQLDARLALLLQKAAPKKITAE
ncbi:terminase small subunit-like protein [Paraburkholderia youngii]|uniref:terminase small subunit-like protein n=1 Tax=Paraburkholderia youngii TaxID=2782701 RepID=UPI0015908E50|nr:hypothetical protein [Paraburkholderia youngii]